MGHAPGRASAGLPRTVEPALGLGQSAPFSRGDLTAVERLRSLRCPKGLAIAETGRRRAAANRLVSKGRDILEDLCWGKEARCRSRSLRFTLRWEKCTVANESRSSPFPPNFAEVLERRCQGLLDAQSAYCDAQLRCALGGDERLPRGSLPDPAPRHSWNPPDH